MRENTGKDNAFLGTEPIGKLLLRLSLPAVLAQAVNMLYNIVDRIFIGHIPGEGAAALTGVGVCLPLILSISAFAALAASGGSPRVSIAMGRGDKEAGEKIIGNCFALLILMAVVLTAVMLLFAEPLLMSFGASENTILYAMDYMRIYAAGTVFVQLTLGMNGFITCQGFAKTGMASICIGAAMNIFLDPLFIYVFHLGVKGAAFATVISQAASAIWILRFLLGKKTVLRLKKERIRLEKKVILPCIALGAATFVMQITESVISVCYNASLLKYGGDIAVGAMTILSSIMQFALMPLHGMGQGAQPITGYNLGAGNRERVKKSFFILLKVCLIYSVSLWLLIELFPKVFAAAFTSDKALIDFCAPALRIYCAVIGLFGAQIACQQTFVAIGSAKCSILVAVMRKIVLLVPLIYIMPALYADKTTAVYAAEPVADLLSVTFASVLFVIEFRKVLKGMEQRLA